MPSGQVKITPYHHNFKVALHEAKVRKVRSEPCYSTLEFREMLGLTIKQFEGLRKKEFIPPPEYQCAFQVKGQKHMWRKSVVLQTVAKYKAEQAVKLAAKTKTH